MIRTTIAVDGEHHLLSPHRDVAAVQHDIVAAVRAGGDLVDISYTGDKSRCALISAGTAVTISQETIDPDPPTEPHPAQWIFDDLDL